MPGGRAASAPHPSRPHAALPQHGPAPCVHCSCSLERRGGFPPTRWDEEVNHWPRCGCPSLAQPRGQRLVLLTVVWRGSDREHRRIDPSVASPDSSAAITSLPVPPAARGAREARPVAPAAPARRALLFLGVGRSWQTLRRVTHTQSRGERPTPDASPRPPQGSHPAALPCRAVHSKALRLEDKRARSRALEPQPGGDTAWNRPGSSSGDNRLAPERGVSGSCVRVLA